MRAIFRAAAATGLAFLALSSLAQSRADGAFHFTAHADRPILTLAREHGMIRGLQERPFVLVFGDGRVRVERPPYMVQPGVFEYRLGAAELDELVASLDRDQVLTLDSVALSRERDAAERSRRSATGERLMTTDTTVTRIKIDFASFARAGDPPAALGNMLLYGDLQIDAMRFPQIEGLQALASAEKRLLALMDHPDMVAAAEATR